MRGMAVLLLLGAVPGALAQPALEPLPAPPPPPPGAQAAPDEPAVRIPVQKEDRIEVIREGGRIVMVKVTPASGGKPYYLVATTGNWMRRDSLDSGLAVPMWPVDTFE